MSHRDLVVDVFDNAYVWILAKCVGIFSSDFEDSYLLTFTGIHIPNLDLLPPGRRLLTIRFILSPLAVLLPLRSRVHHILEGGPYKGC